MKLRIINSGGYKYWRVATVRLTPPVTKNFRILPGNKAKEKAEAFLAEIEEKIAVTGRTWGGSSPGKRSNERVDKGLKLKTTSIVFIANHSTSGNLTPVIALQEWVGKGEYVTMSRSVFKYGYDEAWNLIHSKWIEINKLDPDKDALVKPTIRKVRKYYKDRWNITGIRN